MSNKEFSDQFSTLVNSHGMLSSYGTDATLTGHSFDEYEKSVFLTESQEELVLSLYTGKNPFNDSFELTEEIRRYLSGLIKTSILKPLSSSNPFSHAFDSTFLRILHGVSSHSVFFRLPDDLLFITYESAMLLSGSCAGHDSQEVIPVTQDSYHRLKKDPFRGANFRRALRLDYSGNIVELVSKYPVSGYYLRYLKRPRPIILVDLEDGQSIGGMTKESCCKIHESLHPRILELAVEKALRSRGIGNVSQSTRVKD